ncbi:MAG: phospho-sugar mutase, partial [Clostridiales bacterium]|nr:phospho-sugar mutase [Clostridiales bacterium]
SFAIRHLHAISGINITASHNPKEYNGYKVYWEDGAQLPPEEASVVAKEMDKIDIFAGIKNIPFENAQNTGFVRLIGNDIDEEFLKNVMKAAVNPEFVKTVSDEMALVYTPFHGTGYKLVPEALRRLGYKNICYVDKQMIPDGNFPTVKSPNPEEKAGFELAISLAKEKNIDLIIGTDPDADRIGVVLRDSSGEYNPISGNQIGVLLIDYLIQAKKLNHTLPQNAAVIKTIVTTEMARVLAEKNGVPCFDTFTGFKFMAEKIKEFEESGSFSFLIAFEESYGYLIGNHARDKDAVTAAVLISEMAAYYKTKKMTLYDALQKLYQEYGFFQENTINSVMPGVDGLTHMTKLMDNLRAYPPARIGGTPVLRVRDYLSGQTRYIVTGQTEPLDISGSNVLYFELVDNTRFIVRPSGTEPKIKTYILASGDSKEVLQEKVNRYTKASAELIK